jgi:hypothetical protein
MDAEQVRKRMLDAYGVRVEPQMSEYVIRRMDQDALASMPIIGGDAKTGVPVRMSIDPAKLAQPSA